jgi:hypothetical protein
MARQGGHAQVDFDAMMRHLAVVGGVALAAWTAVGAVTVPAGILTVSPHATLRFLLAVLVLVFARRTYWEIREWRWRRLPPDERYGFANPFDDGSENRARDVDDPATSTEAPQARR